MEQGIVAAADNEVGQLEDEYCIYLYQKLPLMEGDSARVDSYLSSLLQTMKYDEYMETINTWGSSLEVTYNNAALAVYTPAKLKMTAEQLEGESSSSPESSAPESSAPESSAPESGNT